MIYKPSYAVNITSPKSVTTPLLAGFQAHNYADFTAMFHRITTIKELHALCIAIGQTYGLGVFGLVAIDKSDVSAPLRLLGHAEPEWSKLYLTRLYKSDPCILHTFHGSTLLELDLKNRFKHAENFAPEMTSLMQEFEREQYFAFPVQGANHFACGIRFGAKPGESISPSDKNHTMPILALLSTYVHETVVRILQQEDAKPNISLRPREIEILQWIAHGKTTQQVADQLNLSSNTILTHMKNIHSKLGVRSRQHAVARAISYKLITI